MRILLIIPPSYINKQFVQGGLLPSLGIAYIAAVLEEAGHAVKIIDSQIYNHRFSDILRIAKEFNPGLLGFSFTSPQADMSYRLIRFLRTHFKDKVFIAGGAHVTCFPEEAIKENEAIDIIVLGEGEYIILQTVKYLEEKKSLKEIKGIYFRDKGEITRNTNSDRVVNLETLPFPARHLLPLNLYSPEVFENRLSPSTSIIASRGCTYARCTFCYRSAKLTRPYRCQSPKKTIEEIRSLINDYGIKELIFYDDDLLSNHKWVDEFCELLYKEKIKISWSIRARVNAISYDLLRKARDNGCFSLEVGFESGNQGLLDKVKKGISLDQGRRLAEWVHRLGIELVGTFMLALPGETPREAQETIDFAIELDCSYAAFIPTHPFPGTELYEQCLKEGKILKSAYDQRMQGIRFIPKVSYLPDGYKDERQIKDLVRMAYQQFYLRPKYIYNRLRKIESLGDISRYCKGFKFLLGLILNGHYN